MTFTYGCPYGWNCWLFPLNHCTLFYRAYLACLMLVWRLLEIWISISGCLYMRLWTLQHVPIITSALREHWFLWCQHIRQCCYLACVNPVELAIVTEQVIVQFICSHMLFANWTLTCLASAALGPLVFPCCCNFSSLATDFKQVTVSIYEQVFVQFICLPILLTNLALTCSTSAALGAMVLYWLFKL